MSDNSGKNWKKIKEKSELESNESIGDEANHTDHAALEHPTYAMLEEQLTLAEQKAQDHWEKAMRATAELENVRRRADRDIANAHRFGLEKFVVSLLAVIDSLEQALLLVDKDSQGNMVEGLQLTLKLLLDALEKQGVQQLDPIGAIFDPQEHEAMSMQQLPDAVPDSVVAVFQKGYKLNDRVIRPARVIVAQAK